MRTLLVILFLADLVAGLWLTVDVSTGPSADSAASIALDLDAADVTQATLQVQAGRTIRDSAIRWRRDLSVASGMLFVNGFVILVLIIGQAAAQDRVDGQPGSKA